MTTVEQPPTIESMVGCVDFDTASVGQILDELRGPSEPNLEDMAIAMHAASTATLRHLWDIAGRFESRECNKIRDEIHVLNTIMLPAIQDLQPNLIPPPPAEEEPTPPSQGETS